MTKLRRFFAVMFSIFLCISIAATILFSGAVKTMEPESINEIVSSDVESTIEIADKVMDVEQKVEEIFTSTNQMTTVLEKLEENGKTIQDVTNMLGEEVFSDIVSEYASGMTEYLANSKTGIQITEEEISAALEAARPEFEVLIGEEFSDTTWGSITTSFDGLATDIAENIPEYSVIEKEILGDTSGVKSSIVNSVVSGKVVWIFIISSIISAIAVALLVWSRHKWILNFGVGVAAGGALSYIVCLIMNVYSDKLITAKIMESFVLRATSTINLFSILAIIIGLVLIVLYVIVNYRLEKKKTISF